MRLVLINELHPEAPFIGAVRFREFATALRARGHDVILLTDAREPPDEWQIIDMPWGLRQLMIAWRYLVGGGLRPAWRRRMRPQLDRIAAEFKPDIVWATLGSLDCWTLARQLARKAKCPWIADLKDFWPNFIPGLLREPLARRFDDASAWTALSQTHALVAAPWFEHATPTIIYSGFPVASVRTGIGPSDPFVLLFGSLYGAPLLSTLLQGLPRSLRLVYRGYDHAVVETALSDAETRGIADIGGFVPQEELLALQQRATANVYLRFDRTFHHKFLELLAARRPIIAIPGDYDEARAIAQATGVPFFACQTAEQVSQALMAATVRSAVGDPAAIREFSWEAQAAKLEALFETVLQKRG